MRSKIRRVRPVLHKAVTAIKKMVGRGVTTMPYHGSGVTTMPYLGSGRRRGKRRGGLLGPFWSMFI